MVMPIIATTFFARLLPASCRPGRRAPAATQWAKDLDAEAIEETTAGVEGPSAPGRDVQMALVGEQHDTEGENREAEAGPGPDKGVGCFWPNAQSLVSLTRKPTDRKPPAVADRRCRRLSTHIAHSSPHKATRKPDVEPSDTDTG